MDKIKTKKVINGLSRLQNLLLLVAMLILLSSVSVVAIEYDNEVVEQDLTSFSWCFDNPFGTDYVLMKENFVVYQNNFGTELIDATLFVRAEAKQSVEVCKTKSVCYEVEHITTNNLTLKDIKTKVSECEVVEECKFEDVTVVDWFDVSKTSVLMKTMDRFCYKASRKAQTGFKPIDMNFLYNDGSVSIDVESDGKLWWNATWNKKYLFNVSSETINTGVFEIIVNDSFVTMSDCNSDGSDVRLSNYAEDTLLSFNLSSWNETDGVLYVNESIVGDLVFYLYCNASTPQTSNSVALPELTLNGKTDDYYSYDTSGDLNSISSSSVQTKTSTPTVVSGLIEDAYDFTASGQKLVNTTVTARTNMSVSAWVYKQGVGGCPSVANAGILGSLAWVTGAWDMSEVSGGCNYGFSANNGACTSVNSGIVLAQNQWHFLTVTVDGSNGNLTVWANATNLVSQTNGACVQSNWQYPASVGAFNWRADWFEGIVDMVGYYNDVLTGEEITAMYDETVQFPFYSTPSYVVGSGEQNVIESELSLGLFDESYNNISLLVSEGQDFIIWANYSYSDNSTAVYPEGTCNYSVDNIIDENYDENLGVDLTVCGVGCDSTNYTINFVGLHDTGFNYDIYRLKICRDTSSVSDSFTIASNYSGVHTFSYNKIPNCAVGSINFSIIDANISGASDVSVSVWSSAESNKDLVLKDSFVGVDREHNESENLTFHSPTQTFVSEPHEFYEHGNMSVYVDCFDGEDIANQTGSVLGVIVENIPPVIIISSIWDWHTGFITINGVSPSMKYPLVSGINVSGIAIDDDLEACVVNLSYDNTTLITTGTFFAVSNEISSAINFTQSNFSTEISYLDGSDGYSFSVTCNDSTSNESTDNFLFTAQNDKPVGNWTDSTPLLIGVVPTTLNFSCVDDENEVLTSYVFVNGTINQTGLFTSINFSFVEGSYNYSLFCEDSFRNSTQTDLLITYTPSCILNVTGLSRGERYPNLVHEIGLSCVNGVTITSCFYSNNDYASITPNNCSLFNVTLEGGRNKLIINTNDQTDSSFSVWAKDPSANIFSYVGIWIFSLIILVLFIANIKTGLGVFGVIGSFVSIMFGYELYAINSSLGIVGMLVLPFVGIVLALSMSD